MQDRLRATTANRRSPYLIISVLVHVLLLIGVGLWQATAESPDEARERRASVPETMSRERIKQLATELEQTRREHIERYVEDLETIAHEMDRLTERQRERYETFDAEREGTALEDALEAQEKAEAAQEAMGEELEAMEEDPSQPLDSLSERQQEIDEAQQSAASRLAIAGEEAAEAAEAQRASAERQAELNETLPELRRQRNELASARDRAEQARNTLENRREQLAERERAFEKAKQTLEERERALEQAQADDDGDARKSATEQRNRARRQANQSERQRDQARNRVESAEQTLEQRQEELDAAEEAMAETAESLRERHEQALDAQRRARETVQALIEAERADSDQQMADADTDADADADAAEPSADASDETAEANEDGGDEVAESDEPASDDAAAESASGEMTEADREALEQRLAELRENLELMSLKELYERAKLTEREVGERFREMRAQELAMLRDLPLEQALEWTDVPTPEREDLSERLAEADVGNAKAFEQHKQTLRDTEQQAQDMVSFSRSLQSAAEVLNARAEDGLSANTALERQRQLEQLAGEDFGQFADLTDLLASEGEGEGEGEAEQGEGAQAAAGGEGEGAQEGEGEGEQEGEGQASADEGGEGGTDRGNKPAEQVQVNEDSLIPARQIRRGEGRAAEWMYLDSWYIIGPFPNPDRVNLHRRFPPEQGVNLDAVYQTEDGQELRWQFVQSDGPMVAPPFEREYIIYYAYTQVRAEEAQDVWIAVGSDDRSDLWINGQKVWASSDELKGWQIGEGYRKVRLQEGVNDILCRVENGWHGTGFSVVVRVTEP